MKLFFPGTCSGTEPIPGLHHSSFSCFDGMQEPLKICIAYSKFREYNLGNKHRYRRDNLCRTRNLTDSISWLWMT